MEAKEQEKMGGGSWEIWARHASGLLTSSRIPSAGTQSGGLI